VILLGHSRPVPASLLGYPVGKKSDKEGRKEKGREKRGKRKKSRRGENFSTRRSHFPLTLLVEILIPYPLTFSPIEGRGGKPLRASTVMV